MNLHEWCQAFVYLRGKPISFAGRPYLPAIYNTAARRLVLAVRARPRRAPTW